MLISQTKLGGELLLVRPKIVYDIVGDMGIEELLRPLFTLDWIWIVPEKKFSGVVN